jgi:hypothetical protein
MVFLVLALRNVDLANAWQALASVKKAWLGVLLPLLLANLGLRSLRWRWMFPPHCAPTFREAFDAFMLGALGNNLMPGRLGDFLRAAVIGRHLPGMGMSGTLATIILEKVLDGIVVLALLALSFALAPLPDWLAQMGLVGLLAFASAFLALWILNALGRSATVLARLEMHAGRLQQLLARGLVLLQRFSNGLHGLHSKTQLVLLIALSISIWLLETLTVFASFQSFALSLPFAAALVTIVLLCVGTMLPAAPGFIGTYQFFVITALDLYHVPQSSALALAVFLNVLMILVTTVTGLIALSLEGGLVRLIRTAPKIS